MDRNDFWSPTNLPTLIEFRQTFQVGLAQIEEARQESAALYGKSACEAIDVALRKLWSTEWLSSQHTFASEIRRALKLLRAGYEAGAHSSTPSVDIAAVELAHHADQAAAQLAEQEYWFLGRYVDIAALNVDLAKLNARKRQKEDRRNFTSLAAELSKVADRLLEDRSLLDSLGMNAEEQFRRTAAALVALSVHVQGRLSGGVDPFVYSKADPAEDLRELCFEIADCCFRTFLYCDPDILRLLVAYKHWPKDKLRKKHLAEIIDAALSRKVTNAWLRDAADLPVVEARERPWKAGVWIPRLSEESPVVE